MKNIKYILLSAILIGFTSCNEDDSNDMIEEPLPELTTGSADFSKYVSLGASFTAGYTDGALFKASQQSSFPNILAQQFAVGGGGAFTQPLMNDNYGGLAAGGSADDIIGTDGGTANAYIAELTTGVNGIPYSIEMSCLELPTAGDVDINLVCSATATDAENAAVTSPTVVVNGGDWTLGMRQQHDAAANLAALTKKYVYLTTGAATENAYTAGKFVIKIWGAAFDYANG